MICCLQTEFSLKAVTSTAFVHMCLKSFSWQVQHHTEIPPPFCNMVMCTLKTRQGLGSDAVPAIVQVLILPQGEVQASDLDSCSHLPFRQQAHQIKMLFLNGAPYKNSLQMENKNTEQKGILALSLFHLLAKTNVSMTLSIHCHIYV